MDRVLNMQAFTKVVECGGFAAAARKMGLSRSAINKYVMHLEGELGAQLLHRSTRSVKPTDAGYAFYQRCVAILGDLEDAVLAVTNLQAEPRGTLRVNAPMSFGIRFLNTMVAEFSLQYSDLSVELVLTDQKIDTLQEGFDVTVRLAEPFTGHTSLIVKPAARVRRVICAAPSYLERRGVPVTLGELRDHDCLYYGALAGTHSWKFLKDGRESSVQVSGSFCANNAEALLEAARCGLGVTQLPLFVAAPYLEQGQLVQVLQDYDLPPVFIFLIYPPSRHLSIKLSLFTQYLHQRLASLTGMGLDAIGDDM